MRTKIKIFVILFLLLNISASAQFGMQNDLVKIESFQSFDKVYAGGEFKLAVKTIIENPWHINSDKPYDEFLIPTELSISSDINFELKNVFYPKAHDLKLAFSENPLSVWEGEIYLGGLVSVSENIQPRSYDIIVTLDYQACNDNSCLAPTSVQDTITIIVADNQTPANEINQEIFEKINLSYSAAGSTESDEGGLASLLESNGLLLGLFFIFIGGLALNLTPCVYPLIPITIGYFGGQSEGSTSKLTLMGVLFVLGMALTYSVIGVVTALSGAIFGALLQNTFVIIFIALIFVVLSLSMFGVYEFKLPDALVAKAGGAKSGMFGAFFMGLTMGIVAAPCIGPFVIGLVTYVAARANPLEGFLMFFVLAIGLGLPYLFLAIFSGKIKALPRAGEWMDGVKHVFGFILIGMALYFILPLLPKSFSAYVLPAFMIITAIYLLFFEKLAKKVKGFQIFKISFSVLLIAIAAYALYPSQSNSINWESYSSDSIPTEINNKRGIIIDFYADWCIPCKELDALTFSNDRVILQADNFYTFKADMTKSLSPEVEELRKKYNIVGVPTVLIINSDGEEVERITGFVNADEFLKLIENVN
jgi:thioredoxin:protein disulfide reductase